jgi:hypothetical protein
MMLSMAEDILDCYRHAEKCRELAALAHSQQSREDFLLQEQRWRRLARSYEFARSLADLGPAIRVCQLPAPAEKS